MISIFLRAKFFLHKKHKEIVDEHNFFKKKLKASTRRYHNDKMFNASCLKKCLYVFISVVTDLRACWNELHVNVRMTMHCVMTMVDHSII